MIHQYAHDLVKLANLPINLPIIYLPTYLLSTYIPTYILHK
jgi:hypothetical protein